MGNDADVPSEAEWLNRVVAEFERPLSRYALSITHNVDRALDAVQETFLLLVQHAGEIDRAHPAPWLFTVCRTKAIDLLRKDGRMEAHPREDLAQRASVDPPAEDVAVLREDITEVERTLALLPPREREVLRLKFQEGLRYKEIAAVTGLSISHVGVMIHQAMARLRRRKAGPPNGA